MQQITKIFFLVATLMISGTAAAYVGPGAGISVLGALWGLIIGVVMAVGVILFWPIRMMMRKKKAAKEAAAAGEAGDTAQASESAEDSDSAKTA